jgi:tetraacyldisaccharide 4'-kinase
MKLDSERLLTQPLGAFGGVGNPESFFQHLRRENFSLAFTRAFPDHHRYKQSDIETLVEKAKSVRATGLITTAKDAIKLAALKFEIPCYVLEIQIRIDDEYRLVQLIRDTCQNRKSN